MKFTEQKRLEIEKWVFGTIFTAFLPFLAALFSWAEDGFSKEYILYFPYIDSLLLLYAVAVNCFVLTMELEGIHKNKILESVARFTSFSLAAGGALFYMHLMGKEKTTFDYRILTVILISTFINFAIGVVYLCFDYKSKEEIGCRKDLANIDVGKKKDM